MPVYIIGGKSHLVGTHLVRANSRSQALRFVAEKTLVCEVAKGETIAELMAQGMKCEDARAPETAELPLTPAEPAAQFSGDHALGVFTSPTGTMHVTDGKSITPPLPAAENLDAIDKVAIQGIDNVF